MTITAQMVKDLREATGAGMMDVKKALTETDGDMDAAVDWLRTKGLAKAAKKADRVAAEGLIGVAVMTGKGVAVEINSETDFVAKNADFQALVRDVAKVALTVGDSVEVVKAAHLNGKTVETVLQEAISRIGENMNLRRLHVLEGDTVVSFGEVEDEVVDSQLLGNAAGIVDVADAAAAGVALATPQAHRDTDDLVAGLDQQCGRHRRVHPTAHRDHDLHTCTPRSRSTLATSTSIARSTSAAVVVRPSVSRSAPSE